MSDLTDTERAYIKKITPDNAYEMLKAVYAIDDDFDELFGRLPLPLSDAGVIQQTIKLDKELGFTKLKGYEPKESITYKLLTEPKFFEEQSKKLGEYEKVWNLWRENQDSEHPETSVDYKQILSDDSICSGKAQGGGAGTQ